ncbi:MAG: flagellar hook-basal body complex protein FliE [Alphaproteobacteria bacterium]|nr:flagellar hook-basal body complex protein FliE [Alphaproteobacteria bacterium]MCK5658280.1 flagellar hook-basal body complex protein FliE [Alphaproteobacteria bacterium]
MSNVNGVTSSASNALNQLLKSTGASVVEETGPSFGDVLKQSAQSAIDAQRTSEKVSAAALAGKADATDLLQAVTNAEIALNTVLAVRNKVVQAYEQIMRTPI